MDDCGHFVLRIVEEKGWFPARRDDCGGLLQWVRSPLLRESPQAGTVRKVWSVIHEVDAFKRRDEGEHVRARCASEVQGGLLLSAGRGWCIPTPRKPWRLWRVPTVRCRCLQVDTRDAPLVVVDIVIASARAVQSNGFGRCRYWRSAEAGTRALQASRQQQDPTA